RCPSIPDLRIHSRVRLAGRNCRDSTLIRSMANHRYGVIMAGGRGTRFWPRSRKRKGKQVLRLFGERSLIQQAIDRLDGVIPPENIWILTNEFLQPEIRKQLPEVPKQQVIAEPSQRNTAPCIALAAHILAELDPEAV